MAVSLLSGIEVARLLPMRECIAAVERAFRLLGQGLAAPPATLAYLTERGGFHVKVGRYGRYFVTKVNGNFPLNPAENGLPTIQGVVILCDAEDGRVLALMDSTELTALRTAAATAVAARLLARGDATTVGIVGCGIQAAAQLTALHEVLAVKRVLVYDVNAARARAFADSAGAAATADLQGATLASDVIVTCTTSTEFFLFPEHVKPGTFIAAIGVDNESKRELALALLARSKVVTDVTDQCARIGDLHHAIETGAVTVDDVHADLPGILAGRAPGREGDDEVIVFDSTGIGLQDAAAAAVIHERMISAAQVP